MHLARDEFGMIKNVLWIGLFFTLVALGVNLFAGSRKRTPVTDATFVVIAGLLLGVIPRLVGVDGTLASLPSIGGSIIVILGSLRLIKLRSGPTHSA